MGVIFLGEWSYHYIKKFIPQNNQTLQLPLYSEINSKNLQSQKGNDRILIPKREICHILLLSQKADVSLKLVSAIFYQIFIFK